MKTTETFQKLLPFGYLFLVILGILKESVFYYQFGINILKYSNIMDILISPIADLTSHPIVLISCITFILLLLFFTIFLSKNYKKEWVRKLMGSKKTLADLTADEVRIHFGRLFLLMFAFGLSSFFLGLGIGKSSKIASRISQNDLKFNYALTFNTNETKEIFLIGNNSANYFYVEKGSKNVKISPVNSIKALELLKDGE